MLPPSHLAPPLIGAAIGYLTNKIAIRMLFRPLRPWYVFGIRVPLTPGVIPARRRQLADNIGAMVGDHLLTSADIQRGIAAPGFQAELSRLIDAWVADILDRDLGPLPSLVPNRFRPAFDAGVKILRRRGVKLLQEYLTGDDFADRLHKLVEGGAATFLDRPWHTVLDEETTDKLLRFIEEGINRLLAAPETEEWLTEELRRLVGKIQADGRSLADLLPDETQRALLDLLAAELPGLLEHLSGLLSDPAIRRRIAAKIVGALTSFVESLGPVAALLGGFLSADTLAAQVERYLEDHADDIAAWLVDPATTDRLTGMATEKLDAVLHQPLAHLIERLGPERLDRLTVHLAAMLAGWLRSPATASRITALVRQHLASVEQAPLEKVLSTAFGQQRLQSTTAWLAGEIRAALGTSAFRRFLDGVAVALLDEGVLARPLGRLRDFLPRSVREGIGAYLLQQASGLLVREVPALVDGLHIRSIIARKVNSLDLLRLEELLMGIMREQFKYINLFGALLGFVIGLANLLLL